MSGISADLAARTIALWQPRAQRALHENDARLMIDNARGFMGVLQEWLAKAEQKHESSTH